METSIASRMASIMLMRGMVETPRIRLCQTPPSVLPDISPTRGEIGWGDAANKLSPRGGDAWQGRGGHRRAPATQIWWTSSHPCLLALAPEMRRHGVEDTLEHVAR